MSMYDGKQPSLKDERKARGGRASAAARAKRKAEAAAAGNGGVIVVPKMSKNGKKRFSVKDYERRRLLARVYELMVMNVDQKKIAEVMHKSEGWVSSAVKQILEDFSSTFQPDAARDVIAKNLQQFDMLINKAATITATTGDGDARKIAALQLHADLLKKKSEYEVMVGIVKKAPDDIRLAGVIGVAGVNSPQLAELRSELGTDDLDEILLEVAESVRNREAIEAEVVMVP
jgi:hypothetical protein